MYSNEVIAMMAQAKALIDEKMMQKFEESAFVFKDDYLYPEA